VTIDWTTTLQLLAPEVILAFGGLLVLGLDLILADDRHPLLSGASFVTLAAALIASFFLFGQEGVVPVASGAAIGSFFVVDNMTNFFRVLVTATSILVLLVSIDYVRERSRETGEFYALLIWVTLAVVLLAGSTDLIMFFLAFEFLSITSYIMVGWLRDAVPSNEGAMKYLLYGAISSAVMLYGMSLLYGATGSTSFAAIGKVFSNEAVKITPLFGVAMPALALMLAGFGFKIALVPFHQWSPDAYEGAPTPVAAFLSVGSKAAGFAILIRVLMTALPEFAPNWQQILVVISILSMTVGNLVALMQGNMKRMLAYSSIAQAGYVMMGLIAFKSSFEAGGLSGIGGVLVYLFAYLFTNLGAFIAAIAYEEATGSVTIEDYAGMVRRAPWLAGALVIFFLSLAGIPPTAGFIGKFFVFGAAINQGFIFLAVVGVITSVISVVYYFNVVRTMFFLPAPDDVTAPVRSSPAINLALGITVAGTLLFGLYPQPFLNLANFGQRMISALIALPW